MALNPVDLNSATRRSMLDEIDFDVSRALYLSLRLTVVGIRDYPELLRSAAQSGSAISLAAELRCRGRLRTTEERRTPKGGITVARVPITAADTLSEGEFNRFYARGLCRRAMAEGLETIAVYPAKAAVHPRPDSEMLIGTAFDPGEFWLICGNTSAPIPLSVFLRDRIPASAFVCRSVSLQLRLTSHLASRGAQH